MDQLSGKIPKPNVILQAYELIGKGNALNPQFYKLNEP